MVRFPFTLADPVIYPGPPPGEADVVVIGGGVIGVATALYLRERNLSVVLVEKGRIAAEQSSRNWGWIRKQGRDGAELPIVMEAIRLWKELAAESGEDFGLTEAGVTYFARTARDVADFDRFLALAEQYRLDTRLLDGDETARMFPGMSRRFAGALVTPSDMRAEPWLAVPALARLAARKGAVIVENCAARALEISAGRISGVHTEKGRIAASAVVLAGGAWSSLFLQRHGVSIPQLSVRSAVAATMPLPDIHAGAASDDDIAFRRRQDGGYTLAAGGPNLLHVGPDAFRHCLKYLPALKANPLGTRYTPFAPAGYPDGWMTPRDWEADEESPFETMRILDPAPPGNLEQVLATNFTRLYPGIGPIRFRQSWAGLIDAMPDVVPVIDRIEARPGLFVGTGMSGHGFGIGPGVGRILADLVLGNPAGHDLTRFRFGRFTDGSPLRLGPSL